VDVSKQLQENSTAAEQMASEDSDDDVFNESIDNGTLVDVFFERGISGWFPAKVVFSLDEMVKVQTAFGNDKKQECWVELESWKISHHGNMTKNEKQDNY